MCHIEMELYMQQKILSLAEHCQFFRRLFCTAFVNAQWKAVQIKTGKWHVLLGTGFWLYFFLF